LNETSYKIFVSGGRVVEPPPVVEKMFDVCGVPFVEAGKALTEPKRPPPGDTVGFGASSANPNSELGTFSEV
jgi:hypothetical protein